ncbi:MAG TPA: hypothetical protein DD435_12740 [Cyanobacteria bacterium UBA8530]|nr:hypothetical protein [Cyanobacteria bacterium UBA8530]
MLAGISMPGGVSLSFSHEPCFREAIEVEGRDARAIVAENEGELGGVALMAKKNCYLNGKEKAVGYLSSLRLAPDFRSSLVLARGYQVLHKLHREQLSRPPFYLTTIMADNEKAKEILTSGRAGLPNYHFLSGYQTLLIPLVHHRFSLPEGVLIVKGEVVKAEQIVEALNRLGQGRQFFPVYQKEDIEKDSGLLRGLDEKDFYLAIEKDRIVGVLACWDQLAFRQNVVKEYSLRMKLVKKLFDALAVFTRMEPLPRIGEAFKSLSAACVAVEDDRKDVFRALLRYSINDRVGKGKTFLYVGFSERDPLLVVAAECLHATLRSLIYAVEWGEGKKELDALDSRVPYLELGSL